MSLLQDSDERNLCYGVFKRLILLVDILQTPIKNT